jgi:signal transduction histidine kinase
MPALFQRSIRARSTVVVTAVSLIVFALIGVGVDLMVRSDTRDSILLNTQRSALQWIAGFREGVAPHTIATPTRVNLLQLVDSRGRVVDSRGPVSDKPPWQAIRPAANDRIGNGITCTSPGRCVVFTAIRFALHDDPQPGDGDPHFVYAGETAPPILSTHALELFVAAGVVSLAALSGGVAWGLVGRSLRPLEIMRDQTTRLGVNDVYTRLHLPRQPREIALLADAGNEALERFEGALRRQQQFASEASHELRTPVTSLRVRLEEALLYPGDIDPYEVIHSALSATDRLGETINDLLQLARLRADPAPPETIDLGELVRREAGSRTQGVRVVADAAPDVHVHGHRMQLIRVLSNLLDNAQRHAQSHVKITAQGIDGVAVMSVIDDGDGIAPQDRERVFERFTRLADGHRRDPGGSGLGLAISADIAHAHQGSLKIEDSTQGARFVLRLPLVDKDQTPPSTT